MASKIIDKKRLYKLIAADKLKEAIGLIRTYITENDFQNRDKLNQIDTTYSYLLKSLQWMRDGKKDEQRDIILNKIRESLYSIIDSLIDNQEVNESPSLYFTQKRLAKFSGLNFSESLGRFLSADAAIELQYDKTSKEFKDSIVAKNMALTDLFTSVWTSSTNEIEKELPGIENVISDSDISYSLRCILTGALILWLLRNYNRNILHALLNVMSKASSEKIRARAMIGILLCFDKYSERIANDEEIESRIALLSEDSSFSTNIREAVYSLVRARGGDKFNSQLKNEILPGLQKLTPDILKNLKNESGEIDIEKLEENPAWEKMMSESGLEKQMQKFSEMQSNGADMFLSMFEIESKNFFFNEINSWFRPFEVWEMDRLGVAEEMRPVIEMLSLNPTVTDSDKFAMVANIRRMPPQAIDMLKGSLSAHSDQIQEEMKSITLNTSTPEFDIETYNFAKTLFRFFTFFRLKGEFENPFAKALRFTKWPFIGELLSESEVIGSVADFYYKQGFPEDAIKEYQLLYEKSKDLGLKEIARQKIGLAFEKKKDYQSALKYFIEAFENNPEDEWVAKKIIRLSNKLNNFSKTSIEALMMMHSKDKNNLKYLIPLVKLEVDGLLPKRRDTDQPYKFLERAKYIAPEDATVARMALKKLIISEEGGKVSEIEESISKIESYIEMYLAENALRDQINSDEDTLSSTAEGSEEIENMIEDNLYILYYYLKKEAYGNALDALQTMSKLEKRQLILEDIEKRITDEFSVDPTIYSNVKILPILFDALKED